MAPVSTIRITFEGLLVLFINDDREHCDVGFLKDPHHLPEIVITKAARGGAPQLLLHQSGNQLQDKIWLDVNKPSPRVRLHKSSAPDPFERNVAHDNEDFRWAVNFEGHEVYNRELKGGIAFDQLKPMLRINDGKFYCQTPLSSNELKIHKPGEQPVVVGKVAVQLRAEISLDSEQNAFFINGGGNPLPLTAEANIDYGIYVSNKPIHDDESVHANSYHPVLASTIAPTRRIIFDRHPIRVTPDAVCLPAWMGTSQL